MDLQPFEVMRKYYRNVVVIGVGMILSIFLYGVIVFYLRRNGTPAMMDPKLTNILRIALLALSIAQIMIAPFFSRVLLSVERKGTPIYQNPRVWPFFIKNLFKVSLILLVICELPSLFGLFLYVMGKKIGDFFLLTTLSFAALVFYFPRYEQWEYELRKIS